jgi:hypothetical protein
MAVPYKLNYFEIETGIDSTSTFIHTGDLTATKVKKYLATSNDILLGDGTTTALSGLQPTGNYITALTGEATATGPGSVAITLSNAAVIGKLLTGLSITGSTITSTDTILQAFGKVQNQINGKQDTITLTTTGTSGAATLIANTLNIPQYTDAFVGTVTSVSALTLGTTGTDLSSTVANSTTTPVITLNVPTASAANRGALSSTDWTTFNSKQDAGNYITSLTGEATASGPGAASVTLDNTAVIGKVLTGLNVTGGTVISTDTILAAFGKVQNQINGLVGGSIFQGTWDASTNTPALASSVGTNGYYYIVSVDGSTNLNGITDWKVGDWAIFAGTAWQKVDNTDSVASVNGYTGTVSLVTGDVLEGAGSLPSRPSQLYFTDARARAAISLTTSGSSGASTYDSATGVLNIPNYLQDLSGYVTLNTAQTITAAKTFSTSGNSDTLIINHSSGSGIALNITKGGNGEGIYVNKTSGSGNAVTIIGTLNATTLVKSGGTSSQFLKADGSVDSTAYGTGSVTSVAAITLGTSGTDLSSTVANSTTTPVITLNVPDASATARGVVTTGTQTFAGDKTFTGNINASPTSGNAIQAYTTSSVAIQVGSTTGGGLLANSTTGAAISGNATGTGGHGIVGQASGTAGAGGYFSGGSSATYAVFATATGSTTTALYGTANSASYPVQRLVQFGAGAIAFFDNSGGTVVTISNAGNLTANSFVKTGGTSSQFLKADGSVDTNTYQGAITLGAIGITPNANAASLVGSILNLQPANASFGGVVTTGTQTIAGDKNFTGNIAAQQITSNLTSGYAFFTNNITNGFGGYFGVSGTGSHSIYAGAASGNSIQARNNSSTYATINVINDGSGNIATFGNSGIGLASITNAGGLTLTGALSGTSATFSGDLTIDTNTLYVDSTNNRVGIGTASPTFKFDVETSSLTVSRFYSNATGKRNNILIQNSANFNYGVFGVVSATGSSNGDVYGLGYSASGSTAFTEVLNWTSGGNVLIGTTTDAGYKLDVNGTGRFSSSVTATSYGLNNGTFRGGLYTYNLIAGTGTDYGATIFAETSYNIYFCPGGSATKRMTITSGGDVGILTTSPTAKLEVQNSTAALTTGQFYNYAGDQSATTLITRSGRIDVLYHFQAFNNTSIECFRIEANGNVKNTNGSYGSLSDIKIKENISDATPKLEDLLKVRIRNYNIIGQETKQIGVIAQELEEIFPSMVDENQDRDDEGNLLETTTKGVKYSVFVPMLIKAIQELSEKIKILENK